MDGNIIASIIALIQILWVLPVGYFTVFDAINR